MNDTATKTKAEIIEIVKYKVEEDFGKTFDDLKKDILKTVEYGSSDHFKGHGYHLMYTTNENFMQGRDNGGGKGFYAVLKQVGFSQYVRME